MHIAILGAGLMGQVMALQLLDHPYFNASTITLYDDGGIPASTVAAGMIAPFAELDRAASLIATLGRKSLALWPDLLNRLNEAVYFRQNGALVCAHPQEAEALSHYWDKCHRHSITVPCERLTTARLSELEPELVSLQHAIYFPEEGQIDAQQVLRVMQNTLDQHGVRRVTCPIATDCDRSFTRHYDHVIDCRGLGARHTWGTLRAVRGEVIGLQATAVHLNRPVRLLHPRYSVYIVPRPENIFLIGASEIESEDMGPISVRSTMELLSAAYSLHKGFIEARIVHTAVGCRPTLPSHLPEIRYGTYPDGVSYIGINGLYRHGFSLAPILAQEVMHYLVHGYPGLQYPQIWSKK